MNSVKKFRMKDRFIAASKDGMIFGNRNGKGKHITILGKEGRLTMHTTDPDSGSREHLFTAEDSKNAEKEWTTRLEACFRQCVIKNNPKFVYAIPNSVFRFDYVLSKNGKECELVYPSVRSLQKAIVKVPFDEFIKGDCFLGVTKYGTPLMKGKNGAIILNRKNKQLLEKCFLSIPFFAALARGTGKKLWKSIP